MSFAYIDSQGKEVAIPGPDALRLRIELGAVTDSTRFYDAAQDRWGAASEHEIYRQLKREIDSAQSADFMPPSVVEPDMDLDLEMEAADEPDPETDTDPELDQGLEATVDAEVAELDSSDDPGPPLVDDFEWAVESEFDVGAESEASPEADDTEETDEAEPYFAAELDADVFDQAMTDAGTIDPSDDVPDDEMMWPEGATAEELDAGMDTFTLADPTSADTAPSSNLGGEEDVSESDSGLESGSDFAAGDEKADDLGFDFGSAGLELEEEEEEDADASMDDDTVPPIGGAEGGEPHVSVTDDRPDFGMVFEGGTPDDRFDDEPEPDESDADSPSDDGVGDGSSADRPAEGDATRRDPYDRRIPERRGPRSRPPRRGGSGASRVVIGVLVAVVVVGAGAWFMSGSDDVVSPEQEVALPALSPELEPQLRRLAQSATSSMVVELDSLPQRLALADQPGAQWLTGPYLSSASSFDDVRVYWERFDALLDAMIASEDELWATAWDEQLAAAGLAAEAEARIRERGTMGWEAAAPDRDVVYQQLRGVIDASLDLHRFLVENEPSITFDPSTGGGAGDPVLEVVPATPELGDEMWTGVGRITVALDALGYIQQVETAPLLDAVKAKLVTIGIR